ncbi:MAG: GNAT family N-acetyltransferase, partial [Actinomycetales bacterium]
MIRSARTSDIKSIRRIIDLYTLQRRLLAKETVTLYEDVQEFVVAEVNGEVVGCGALHVLWEDLGEVRTVAVLEGYR